MFQAVTRKGKMEGLGGIAQKDAITQEDMDKLSLHFQTSMKSKPNAANLQEIVLFNIIYYTGRRGRENLQKMTKDTFEIKCNMSHICHSQLFYFWLISFNIITDQSY